MWLAGRRKFEKLGINENYCDTNGAEKTEKKEKKEKSPSKQKRETKISTGSKIFGVDLSDAPEEIKPSTKFTYSKSKKTETRRAKRSAEEIEPPSKAVFFLMAGVFVLMILARHLVSEKMLSQLSGGKAALIELVVDVAVFFVPVLVYILSSPGKKSKYYAKGFSASTLPFAAVMFLFVICFTALQKSYLAYNNSYSAGTGALSGDVLLVLVTGAVLPAIFEPLVVHGVFQYEISKYAGGLCGVFVSALVFAFLQFDIGYFFVYLSVGIVMGTVTHVSGSVFPAMIIRFVSCSVSLLFSDRVLFVAQERIGGTLLMIILAVFCFVFLIVALRIAERISNKRAIAYLKKSKADEDGAETDGETEKKENVPVLFIAKDGNTVSRIGKVILSPYMLFAIAVFVIELILKQS